MHGSVSAVTFLGFSFLSGFAAYPQSSKFMRVETGSLGLDSSLSFSPKTCTPVRPGTWAGPLRSREPSDVPFPCEIPPPTANAVATCSAFSLGPNGCLPTPRDWAREKLETRGKTGQRILQARERVLEILQTENACSEWFRTKDSDPAGTFRTLTFDIDRKGQEYVVGRKDLAAITVFYHPYVAKVIQGNGSYSTITLNANGAFFFPTAQVRNQAADGGPVVFHGLRTLQVGPYTGNTLPAQVLTLLHELGHLVDILPVDENDREGRSLQNSMEVLRYCRPEIESRAKTLSPLALTPR